MVGGIPGGIVVDLLIPRAKDSYAVCRLTNTDFLCGEHVDEDIGLVLGLIEKCRPALMYPEKAIEEMRLRLYPICSTSH